MAIALALTVAGYVALLGPLFWILSTDAALTVSAAVLVFVALVSVRADAVLGLVTAPIAVDEDDYPELVVTVDRLAAQAGVPRPHLALLPGHEANALSVGTGGRATICVTAGLVNDLDDEELEAVLAHELSHLANGDSTVMTVAGFPAAVATGLLTLAKRYFSGWAYLFGYVLALVPLVLVGVPLLLVSLPGTVALSRYREYAADRGAVALTGDPAALVGALRTLHDAGLDTPGTDYRRLAGFGAFCFVPTGSTLLSLPSTHPPADERIRRLDELAADLERGRPSPGPSPDVGA